MSEWENVEGYEDVGGFEAQSGWEDTQYNTSGPTAGSQESAVTGTDDKAGFDWGSFGQSAIPIALDVARGQQGGQQYQGPNQISYQGLDDDALRRSNIMSGGFGKTAEQKAKVQLGMAAAGFPNPAGAINTALKRREERFQKEVDGYNQELQSMYDRQEAMDKQYLEDMHADALKGYQIQEDQNKFMNNFYNAARQIKKANKQQTDFMNMQSQEIQGAEMQAEEDLGKIKRWGL